MTDRTDQNERPGRTGEADDGTCVVLTTTANLEAARHLAHRLVDERWVACAQLIDPMRSIYLWQGEVCEESEVLLLLKTESALFDGLSKRLRELHDYDTPEVVRLEGRSEQRYRDWLARSTREA